MRTHHSIKSWLALAALTLNTADVAIPQENRYSANILGAVGQNLPSGASVQAISAPAGTVPMILGGAVSIGPTTPASAVLFGPASASLLSSAEIKSVARGTGATVIGICKTTVSIPFNTVGTYLTIRTPTQPDFSSLDGAWFWNITSGSSTQGELLLYGIGGNPVQNHITNYNGAVDLWETTVMVQTFNGSPLLCNAGDLIQISSSSTPTYATSGTLSSAATVTANTPATIKLAESSWTLGNQIIQVQNHNYILCLPVAATSGTGATTFLTPSPFTPGVGNTLTDAVASTSLRVSHVIATTTNDGFYAHFVQLTNSSMSTISWANGDLCQDGPGALSYAGEATLAAAATTGQWTLSTVFLTNAWPSTIGNCIVQVAGDKSTACYLLTSAAVIAPPVISEQPTNLLVLPGTLATFGVSLSGTAPIGYQWQFNGSNLPHATNAFYSIPSAGTNNAGYYSVVATNLAGIVTSSNAALTVVLSPQSLTNRASTTATFTATAFSPESLNYQWQKNGMSLADGDKIAGATNSRLTVAYVAGVDAARYRVVVSDATGSVTTSDAVLMVNDSLFIASQPQSQTIGLGSNVTFSVTVYGAHPFVFQWYFNGAPVGSPATGTNFSSCTIANAGTSQAGNYTVFVVNDYGSLMSSNAVLTVRVFPPTIGIQPSRQSVMLGTTASFGVSVSGTPPFRYQWQFNGTNLVNATNAVYTIQAVGAADTGNYSVVVANSAGSATSSSALMTVIIPPSVTVQMWAGYPLLGLIGMFSSNLVVQYSTNLADTNWINLLSLPNLQVNPYLFIDSGGVGKPARFYRALME